MIEADARLLRKRAKIGSGLQSASPGGPMASGAALTELAALRQDDVAVIDEVLEPSRLGTIVDELDFAYWRPTEIGWRQASGEFKRGVSFGRRSESTSEFWFGEELRREIALLEERICPPLGLTRHHLETWQASRYQTGGYFDTHLDGDGHAEHPAGGRAVTLLLYLNTPARGGGTLFPELSLEIDARAGRLLVWRNLLADGSLNPKMAHAGQLVEDGTKVILMTWARERPVRTTEPAGA